MSPNGITPTSRPNGWPFWKRPSAPTTGKNWAFFMTQNNPVLTADLARHLNVSRARILQLVRVGKLPPQIIRPGQLGNYWPADFTLERLAEIRRINLPRNGSGVKKLKRKKR